MNKITITELPPFDKKAAKLFRPTELDELKSYLMLHPDKGDVIPGTGGIRKMRWASGNKGKRGGARVIYFYHVVGTTIYLMTCYTKNEQADISLAVKKQLKAMAELIKKGA